MGFIGKIVGFVVGLLGGFTFASFIISKLPFELPCLYKTLFVCTVGPEMIIALAIAVFISKTVGKIIPL